MSLGGVRVVIGLSEERLAMIPKYDADKLRDVIGWWGTQEHVRTAARERLAMLTRAGFGRRASKGLDTLKRELQTRES
jgi:hypothetical protein